MFPRRCLQLVSVLFALSSGADEAAPAPTEAEAERLAAQHGFRVEVMETEPQDPVVFTEIRPFVVEETPVRLPEDQSLE